MNKKIYFLLVSVVLLSFTEWHYDLNDAKQIAKKEHRHILVNFSGSDWCGPCIRMHKEIFDSEIFLKMADSELVLLNADFPRMKKNRLPVQQQQLNDALADQYNSAGKFPFTVLLNDEGKVLKDWDGLPDMNAAEFTAQVKSIIDQDR